MPWLGYKKNVALAATELGEFCLSHLSAMAPLSFRLLVKNKRCHIAQKDMEVEVRVLQFHVGLTSWRKFSHLGNSTLKFIKEEFLEEIQRK